ncbi:hypothetical protein ERO13_A06G040900v2 [Gossypium hirsutum]|nr:hypothetical protein ERO13_A06G040900v2 [Gossypium hirsutum]
MISLSPRNELKNQLGYLWLKKIVGDNPQCSACQAKGVVLCTTCAGSGLYVDSILESQGIIVKVRCLVQVVEEPAMSCAQNVVAVVIEDPSNLWLAAFYM